MHFPRRACLSLLSSIGWALLALTSVGCSQGPDLESICRQRELCLGGNDADLKSCVDLAELRQEQAASRDCEDEFDAAGSCMEGALSCRPSGYASSACSSDKDCTSPQVCLEGVCSSPDFRTEPGRCEREQSALQACSGQEFVP